MISPAKSRGATRARSINSVAFHAAQRAIDVRGIIHVNRRDVICTLDHPANNLENRRRGVSSLNLSAGIKNFLMPGDAYPTHPNLLIILVFKLGTRRIYVHILNMHTCSMLKV